MRKVLITGVNGFIGSHLAKEYQNHGYEVIGVGRSYEKRVEVDKYYQIDLLTDSISEVLIQEKPNVIIHCAGLADVNYAELHVDSDFDLNVVVTRKMLYDIERYSSECRIIIMSSAAVYGNPTKLPIMEEDDTNPISTYALDKSLIENISQYFIRKYDMDIMLLRIFSAYGEGLKKQIFWDMGQKYAASGRLNLLGTGQETRDYIHIDDLCNAVYMLSIQEKRKYNIYNVANGVEIKIADVAKIFIEVAGGKEDDIVFSRSENKSNPINWKADISRLKEIGYVPNVNIEDGIKRYVVWLRERKIIM